MNRPSLMKVTFTGILFSGLAAFIFYIAITFTTLSLAWIMTITAFSGFYLAYLNHLKRGVPGSVLCLGSLLVIAGIWSVMSLSILVYALLCALIIWIAKTNTFKYSVASRLFDLIMMGFSLAAAYTVFTRTGSIAMTFWSFCLCQVISFCIQSYLRKASNIKQSERHHDQNIHQLNQQFERAYQSAESAMREIL